MQIANIYWTFAQLGTCFMKTVEFCLHNNPVIIPFSWNRQVKMGEFKWFAQGPRLVCGRVSLWKDQVRLETLVDIGTNVNTEAAAGSSQAPQGWAWLGNHTASLN